MANQSSTEPAPETPHVHLTDQQWRERLNAAEYHVLREAGTEAPGVGEYTDTTTEGVYACRACGAELFTSETKFESHCGWPSFYAPTDSDAVILKEDNTLGMRRVEVRCARCGSPGPTAPRWPRTTARSAWSRSPSSRRR